MRAAAFVAVATAAIAAALVVRARAPKPPEIYEVEHDTPPGWVREEGTPSTVFLYRHPETRCLISGSLSHSPVGIAAQSGPDKAKSMASTPMRMQVLGEVPAGDVLFGIVSRGGWEAESLTAFGSKGRTMLAVTLSGPSGEGVRSRKNDFESLLKTVRFRPATP